MSFKSFRSALIIHFDEKWERDEIVWPSRIGVVEVIKLIQIMNLIFFF